MVVDFGTCIFPPDMVSWWYQRSIDFGHFSQNFWDIGDNLGITPQNLWITCVGVVYMSLYDRVVLASCFLWLSILLYLHAGRDFPAFLVVGGMVFVSYVVYSVLVFVHEMGGK